VGNTLKSGRVGLGQMAGSSVAQRTGT